MANWLDESTEAELVRGLRERSPAAAEALAHLFLSRLKALARTWGLQDADAYSVALEALMKVVRRIDSFTERPGAAFRSWVLRIMLNCLKDFVKARNRQREHEVSVDTLVAAEALDDNDDEQRPARPHGAQLAAPTSEAQPDGGARTIVATAVLDRLTPRERGVMIHTGNGMCDADIAAELGISQTAVRVARLRARAHAREALGDIAPTLDESIQQQLLRLLSQYSSNHE